MSRKRKLLLVLPCLLLSLSLFASSASAYINYRYNSVTAQVQQKTLWCWAAVSSMLGNYLGATPTQSQIVTYIYGSPVDQTGTVTDMKNALANWNVSSTALLTTISFGDIIYNIDRNMNMNAAIGYHGGGGHALLIRGYYQDTSNSTQTVYYIDPFNGSYNTMSYSSFSYNSNWYWGNTLTAVYIN